MNIRNTEKDLEALELYSSWKNVLLSELEIIEDLAKSSDTAIYIYRNHLFYRLIGTNQKERELTKDSHPKFYGQLLDTFTNFLSFLEENTYIYRIQLEGKTLGLLYLEGSTQDEGFPYLENWSRLQKRLGLFLINLVSQKKSEHEIKNYILNFKKEKAEAEFILERRNADYFLISLLLNPFQANKNVIENIKTDFLLEQKNQFKFRKKDHQIGGDLCITDTIPLHDGHEYTFFLNSDAMGKSIQGAGGALVLASVIEANILRLKTKNNYNTYPEHCLKSLYLDLQNVFYTFNGSMYSSLCMGLIHSETGFMYYFNAEHPFTVLFRDGKASFLEDKIDLWKIGTAESELDFSVKVVKLLHGDEIFIGSDGKDDLTLMGEDGIEFVQEDDTLFLRLLEKSGGDIPLLIQEIKEYGQLRDDISILKISYFAKYPSQEIDHLPANLDHIFSESYTCFVKNDLEGAIANLEVLSNFAEKYPEIQKLLGKLFFYKGDYLLSMEYFDAYNLHNPEDNLFRLSGIYPEFLKLIGLIYKEKNEYSVAIECIEEYLYIRPYDNEFIYQLAALYNLMGKLDRSADLGERLFLRARNHEKNLLNLIDVYIKKKVKARSLYLLDLIKELDYATAEQTVLESRIKDI
jgi:tetratricopeptide (TPR) repeat protein